MKRFSLLLCAALCAASVSLVSAAPATTDAPEISRSSGVENGVVVLWPRIIPGDYRAASRDDAARIQQALVEIARNALPGYTIDVRPEPERVCGQAGCRGVSVGALLLRDQGGVAVLALVNGPGRSFTRIIPWTGRVRLAAASVPFREPPENRVTVEDFGLLNDMDRDLALGHADIRAALREAARADRP